MIRALADGLLAAALAPSCAVCSDPLERPTRSVVCSRCWASIRPLRPPFCDGCGDPVPASDPPAALRCPRCRSAPGRIALARAAAEYEGAMRSILHAFKFDGRRSLAPRLAGMMRATGGAVLSGADCVVPVPLHWRRRWRRGFNQAAELARGLGLPIVHALARSRPTRPQANLPAAARRTNVGGAFRSRRSARLRGTCVVLVDDVSTTGATLEACAHALLGAGAREVRALTAARVVTGRPPARDG